MELTEGRVTGFPTIYDSMEANGSPKPIFETDKNYNYSLTILPIHSDFNGNKVEAGNEINLGDHAIKILRFCLNPESQAEILWHLNLKNHTDNYKRYMEPLIKSGLLALTYPNSINAPNQRYTTTEEGKRYLKK